MGGGGVSLGGNTPAEKIARQAERAIRNLLYKIRKLNIKRLHFMLDN